MDMTFAEKRTVPAKALAVLLALALAFGGAIGMAFAEGAAPRAATPVNTGDPFDNGDLVDDAATGMKRLNVGIKVKVTGEIGAVADPFPYPEGLKGLGSQYGWGVSGYTYSDFTITNTRGIKYTVLPDSGKCCQSTNATVTHYDCERRAKLLLMEGLSGWSDDGSVYHGVFALLVENDHACTLVEGGNWDQATLGRDYVYADWEVEGGIVIYKRSANTAVTSNNPDYSLEGAKFGVYTDKACTDRVATLTTNASGKAVKKDLDVGTYYVKETKASPGYKVSGGTQKVTVEAGVTKKVYTDADTERWIEELEEGYLDLVKVSATPSITDGNACYSLAGAAYGIYTDAACKTAPVDTMTTDGTGYAKSAALAGGIYYVKETKAPAGYYRDDTVYGPYKVGAGNTVRVNTETVSDLPGNDPAQFFVCKVDADTGKPVAQGGASLAGAQFTVRYYDGQYSTAAAAEASGAPTRTWVVSTNEFGDAALDQQYLISGDVLYRNVDGDVCIPIGTILIQETKAPAGYKLPADNPVHVRNVTMAGDAIDSVVALNPPVVKEQIIRGDMELAKYRGSTLGRLAGIPFRLTNLATGESHIIVTDANGEASTESAWNAHSASTNANDAAVAADGTVDEARLDPSAGIWFYGAKDASQGAKVDDAKGALPYGKYRLEELKVSANSAYTMVAIDFEIAREGYTFEVQVPNESAKTPWISTTARDADSEAKTAYIDEESTIIDRVEYGNLEPGASYTLRAELMDAATAEPICDAEGTPITAEKEFTAKAAQGSVEVEIEYDSRAHAGKRVVVFEELTDADGKGAAEHKDIEDFDQTVRNIAPRISTTARDGADGDKAITAQPNMRIVDTVAYKDLKPGASYTMTGTLNIVGEAGADPLLGADGKPVTAAREFTPEDPAGTIDLAFDIDATGLAGKSVVVYESLELSGALVAEHADPADAGQTVVVEAPKIGTKAADAADGDQAIASGRSVTVVDTVRYEGLTPGAEYTVAGTLHGVAEDGTCEPIRNADGTPVTAQAGFTAAASAGEVQVSFTFDSTKLAGVSIVAFEELYAEGVKIASHEDPSDPEQTVASAPMALDSIAADAFDGDKAVTADSTAKVADTVAYSGAAPGEAYTLHGILVDADSGLPVLSAGKAAVEVDEAQLAAFWAEYARACGIFGGALRERSPFGGAETETQRLYGTAAELPMAYDAAALAALLAENPYIAGRLVTATASFEARGGTGEAALAYALDARELKGKAAVSLCYAVDEAGDIVAVHADPADSDQTVTFATPSIKTKAADATDGDNVIYNSTEAHVVDTVTYTAITPGVEYTLEGTLIDKSTGKPVLAGDKPVEGKATFTPSAANGEAQVDFIFDASKMEGKELVCYEYLYRDMEIDGTAEPVLVAQHTDAKDEDQTVTVTGTAPGEAYPKTGVLDDPWQALAIALGAVALTAAGCILWQRRRLGA